MVITIKENNIFLLNTRINMKKRDLTRIVLAITEYGHGINGTN